MDNINIDFNLAVVMANLSHLAYSKNTFTNKNSSFLIENKENYQYIIFPGSYGISDWVENGEFVKVKREGLGSLHNGFADQWDLINDKLFELADKKKPIRLGGHSLGGALSMIAALSLKNKGFNIDSVYTFGSPRVGNKDWFNIYNKANIPTYRFIAGPDIIPTIPDFFYYHVGKSIYLGSDGKLLPKQESAFEWKFWKITANRALSHKIENYQKLISKLIIT